MGRLRLDQLLVERGLFESRAKARAAVEAGRVQIDGRAARKPSELVDPAAGLAAEPAYPWVGRGGIKLDFALDLWPAPVKDAVVLDVGASTGGFTEVCLARGARRVYAVDVGRGQLHPTLAADPRVTSLEGTDARGLDATLIPEPPSLLVCDASFIGLSKVLARPLQLAAAGAHLIALVKPQFEVGPERVDKGRVRDAADRRAAVENARAWLVGCGWRVCADCESPIAGGEGAIEHLIWASRT